LWTGATDNSWDETGNWDDNTVPIAATDVSIPAGKTNYPTITASAVCNNLDIASGASILDGGFLTVNGTATVERDYSGGHWHLIGSPVIGETANTFLGLYLQSHDEPSNLYSDIIDLSTPLVPGQGYALWNGSSATASYSGSLSSVVERDLTVSGDSLGWNLVGNPYPSSIDWEAPSGWNKYNVFASTYCLDGAGSGNWAAWNGTTGTNGATQYIASGQGFFVECEDDKAGTGNLEFSNDVRVHHNTTFFKDEPTDIIKLKVSGNNYSDEMAVYFRKEATVGFDGQMDAHKLPSFDEAAPYIYSTANSGMAINVLPEVAPVDINVKVGAESGTFVVEAVSNGEFSELFFQDLATGIVTDLNMGSYTFDYIPNIDNRFVLHFSPLSVDDISENHYSIYSYENMVNVISPEVSEGSIRIMNTMGQVVAEASLQSGTNKLTVNGTGTYIVQVVSGNGVQTKKVIIK